MTADRIMCCIPGCRRSTSQDRALAGDEFICRRHWITIDRPIRERQKRAKARIRKIRRLGMIKAIRARGARRLEQVIERAYARENAAWDACKRDATIKAAMGAEDAPRRRPNFSKLEGNGVAHE